MPWRRLSAVWRKVVDTLDLNKRIDSYTYVEKEDEEQAEEDVEYQACVLCGDHGWRKGTHCRYVQRWLDGELKEWHGKPLPPPPVEEKEA